MQVVLTATPTFLPLIYLIKDEKHNYDRGTIMLHLFFRKMSLPDI